MSAIVRLTPAEALAVLGLAPGATSAQVRQAYKRAARATHPDRGGDSSEFQAAAAAHDFLIDGLGVTDDMAKGHWATRRRLPELSSRGCIRSICCSTVACAVGCTGCSHSMGSGGGSDLDLVAVVLGDSGARAAALVSTTRDPPAATTDRNTIGAAAAAPAIRPELLPSAVQAGPAHPVLCGCTAATATGLYVFTGCADGALRRHRLGGKLPHHPAPTATWRRPGAQGDRVVAVAAVAEGGGALVAVACAAAHAASALLLLRFAPDETVETLLKMPLSIGPGRADWPGTVEPEALAFGVGFRLWVGGAAVPADGVDGGGEGREGEGVLMVPCRSAVDLARLCNWVRSGSRVPPPLREHLCLISNSEHKNIGRHTRHHSMLNKQMGRKYLSLSDHRYFTAVSMNSMV